ncbi:MAG: rhamnan synthesis F family protein [Paracoccaceae bacterium]
MNRCLIYFIYHPKGRIDPYIEHMLLALRPRFDHIHVVFNGRLASGASSALYMADTIQERPNTEFDVGAYRAAIKALPGRGLADIEELTLANFTFFGPVNDLQNIWEWADAQDVDFWGLSAHGALDHNPFGEGALPYHLNSHWITIRAPMLHSKAFADWWLERPKIASYAESVLHHESCFTAHFEGLGYRHAAFLDPAQDGAAYPAFDEADEHIAQDFPILKRRLFYHTPVAYGDWHKVNPRRALEMIAAKESYDSNLIWQSLAGMVDPWVLYQNADLLFIMDGNAADKAPDHSSIFELHVPAAPLPSDLHQLKTALTIPVELRLSGKHCKEVAQAFEDHPMVRSISTDAAHKERDAIVLLARLLPGEGGAMAAGLAHIALNPAVARQATEKIDASPSFGLAFSPVQTHGPEANANAQLAPGTYPPLGQGANIAWARAQLARMIAADWPAPETWAARAAEQGLISIAISNTQELPRSFVKLEARYRALAGQLETQNPFEAPARLAHLIAYPNSSEAKAAWEKAAEIAHDAGHKTGFDAGFTQGYAAAHTPAFEDGFQKGFAQALAQISAESPGAHEITQPKRRLTRWRA